MKHPVGTKPKKAKGHRIALALTWDGARWPIGKLPMKARTFLKGQSKSQSIPIAKKLSQLFRDDAIQEMRICWVPRLNGGKEVLTEPFAPPAGKRLGFIAVRTIRLGDILGVIYRR